MQLGAADSGWVPPYGPCLPDGACPRPAVGTRPHIGVGVSSGSSGSMDSRPAWLCPVHSLSRYRRHNSRVSARACGPRGPVGGASARLIHGEASPRTASADAVSADERDDLIGVPFQACWMTGAAGVGADR